MVVTHIVTLVNGITLVFFPGPAFGTTLALASDLGTDLPLVLTRVRVVGGITGLVSPSSDVGGDGTGDEEGHACTYVAIAVFLC